MDAGRRQTPFSPDTLAQRLATLPAISRFWVAYSGGVDSHVLLHAVAHLRQSGLLPEVRAVHVDHGLQSASSNWAQHCAAMCADMNVPLSILRVDARAANGESPEAAARKARYHAIADLVSSQGCLLTAHHQDDQAETLMLQLLRGGGPHGLAAMPELTAFAGGWHARPLLAFSREALHAYARQHGLQWIDDPSNENTGFDRNFLRHSVMPLLRERWPAVARVLTRSASHQAEAAHLLDTLAVEDLTKCQMQNDSLSITSLLELDEARQRNALRFWLKSLGHKLPDTVRLNHLLNDLLHAAPDRSPELHWQGVSVRRYRDRLFALSPLETVDSDAVLSWNMTAPLELLDGTQLHAVPVQGGGVKAELCRNQSVTVRFRQGGETCRISPRAANRPLKHLLQEAGVPPWERERIPLVYLGERLAAVAGYWECEPCQASDDEAGVRFEWRQGG